MREALPRVIELHFSKLGFDIGSVCSFQVDGAASTCHVLLIYVHAFSLLLFVSPGGSKGWASHSGVITSEGNKGAGLDWVLGTTVHVIDWVKDR